MTKFTSIGVYEIGFGLQLHEEYERLSKMYRITLARGTEHLDKCTIFPGLGGEMFKGFGLMLFDLSDESTVVGYIETLRKYGCRLEAPAPLKSCISASKQGKETYAISQKSIDISLLPTLINLLETAEKFGDKLTLEYANNFKIKFDYIGKGDLGLAVVRDEVWVDWVVLNLISYKVVIPPENKVEHNLTCATSFTDYLKGLDIPRVIEGLSKLLNL